MDLKKGLRFKSKWFGGITTVNHINEEDNDLEVDITNELGNTHHENWNLKHTIWGFENGDYFEFEEPIVLDLNLKFISVENHLPTVGKNVIWRVVTNWKSKNKVRYFDDVLTLNEEPLEYGQVAYLLEDNSDYLVSQHPNISEICDEFATHWAEIPEPLL